MAYELQLVWQKDQLLTQVVEQTIIGKGCVSQQLNAELRKVFNNQDSNFSLFSGIKSNGTSFSEMFGGNVLKGQPQM